MKKRNILYLLLIIVVIVILGIFIKNMTKSTKIGNTNISQEIDIFNISSYEATIDITVYSNKNENKYKIKQKCKSGVESSQEIIEPSNIAGVKIIQEENQLKIENSKLNLTKIIENYPYITDNCIDLDSFVKDYKQNETSNMKEENDTIILETTSNTQNPYIKHKTLTIDKKTGKPLKMEIKADNQKTSIYILYSEVKIKN